MGIINAIDPDVGNNAIVSYTVISDWGNDVFSLNPQTGVFTLTARLDYEEVSHFQINCSPFSASTISICCHLIAIKCATPFLFHNHIASHHIYGKIDGRKFTHGDEAEEEEKMCDKTCVSL